MSKGTSVYTNKGYENLVSNLDTKPSGELAVITPNDSVDLSVITRAVYVGADGDLKVDGETSGTVTFIGLKAGMYLPISVKRVYATGTTASNILSLA